MSKPFDLLQKDPTILLRAYASGVFPMARSAHDQEIFWVDPEERGILPLANFHIPRSLKKRIKKGGFKVTIDRAFENVLDGCANREETWINPTIKSLYLTLHQLGHAHSIEVWMDDELVGGLYGVRLGAAFFGESMFSTRTDASKIALCWLVARLKRGGFTLLDTQFVTKHLTRFGTVEVARADYHRQLEKALEYQPSFWALPEDVSWETVMQLSAQTS